MTSPPRSIIEDALLVLKAVFGNVSEENPLPVKVKEMHVDVATGIFYSSVEEINGAEVTTGAGATAAGTQRVTLATDDVNAAAIKAAAEKIDDIQDTLQAPGSAAPSKAVQVGGTDGTNTRALKTDATGNLLTAAAPLTNTFAQLTAPGASASFAVPGRNNHTVMVTVANINTNVVVRIEMSLDNTNWGNADASGLDTTITVNGSTPFVLPDTPMGYIRVNFVSESGGTAATIDAKYLGH